MEPTKPAIECRNELEDLRTDMIRLGAMVLESIPAATAALLDSDLIAVDQVIAAGSRINALTTMIEERCYQLLATQTPTGTDLRTVIATLRVDHELELTGNLMISVVKASRRLYPYQLEPRVRGLIDRMREQVSNQMELAMDAFADLDAARASALADMDDVMGDLQKELFRTILSATTLDDAAIQRAVQVALVGRYFERAADHAVSIGERVTYMVTGKLPSASSQQSATNHS